jgi:hypothetical protein
LFTDAILTFTDKFQHPADLTFLAVDYRIVLIKNKLMDFLSDSNFIYTEDYIYTTALFGGIQRTIISKKFKGGKIRNFCSSSELDFTHADINGVAELDISQAFGHITIAVPADWHVEANLDHIASVVDEDRAHNNRGYKSNKVLLLKGLSMFSAVDIVNRL